MTFLLLNEKLAKLIGMKYNCELRILNLERVENLQFRYINLDIPLIPILMKSPDPLRGAIILND